MTDDKRVTTGEVRLSYVHLTEPYAYQEGDVPKYSCTVLVPQTDKATKQRLDSAINVAIDAGISSKWNGTKPPKIAVPVYDGNGERPSDGMPFGEECKDHWVFTASNKNRIEIVDRNLNPIIDTTEIYSGMYARVCVQFFPYNSNGKKGIGCSLGPVQKTRDGEPLGSHITAAEAFGSANASVDPITGRPTTF